MHGGEEKPDGYFIKTTADADSLTPGKPLSRFYLSMDRAESQTVGAHWYKNKTTDAPRLGSCPNSHAVGPQFFSLEEHQTEKTVSALFYKNIISGTHECP